MIVTRTCNSPRVGNFVLSGLRWSPTRLVYPEKLAMILHALVRKTPLCRLPRIYPVESSFISVRFSSKESKDESGIPKNVLEKFHSSSQQTDFGLIYDNKPFKMKLSPNKTYNWCCCGHSKNQPFCDGSHKSPYVPIKLRPVRFKVEEEKDYWLCNCKQTSHRPFCDGTHKREDIQSKK